MSLQSRVQPANISADKSMNVKPLKLADATCQAVNQLGAVAAKEIERTVDEFMREANEIAEHLDELANAIRHHSLAASEYVAEFCTKATSVSEAVIELQNGLLRNRRDGRSGRGG